MSQTIIWTIAILTVLGLLLAIILWFIAERFKVVEDPRIDEVEKVMPGANCGGCGFAGCRAFADSAVKAPNLDNHYCPVGGNEVMQKVAAILGHEVKEKAPMVAVVRCNGTCEARPTVNDYDGLASCKVKAALYAGDTGCSFGCLGCGDCVNACTFGALSMDPVTGLPVVDETKCTACGACAKACPKGIIELRPKGPRGLRELRQQGQGPGREEGLRQCLYRLQPLREDLYPRRHRVREQRGLYRSVQVQALPRMRGILPDRRDPCRQLPQAAGRRGRQGPRTGT